MDNTIKELKGIIEKLHTLYWDNRNNGKYWTYLSFACNLIYLVIKELEGKCETHANGK